MHPKPEPPAVRVMTAGCAFVCAICGRELPIGARLAWDPARPPGERVLCTECATGRES